MSQHDMVIDDGPGLAVRTDMNAAIQALASTNAGAIEPTTMYAGMLWLDTSVSPNGLLRQRNQANSAWVDLQTGATSNPLSVIGILVLTSSGSYVKPANLKFLDVCVVGGGGGGTRAAVTSAGQSTAGGGGGGGGVVQKLYRASDLSASEPCTVGAGGVIATGVGQPGGNSTFKGLTAGGGGGGGGLLAASASFAITPGRGTPGSAAGGDLNIPGGRGGYGYANLGAVGNAQGGEAGQSFFTTPNTMPIVGGFSGGAIVAGIFPGGGACGESNGPSLSASSGQPGAAGCIIIKEYS